MLKKSFFIAMSFFAIFFVVNQDATAGFKIKNILKTKSNDSSANTNTNTNTSTTTKSTTTSSNNKTTVSGSPSGNYTYTIINKDNLNYEIRYQCFGASSDKQKHDSILKAGKTFSFKGSQCAFWYMSKVNTRRKKTHLPAFEDYQGYLYNGDLMNDRVYKHNTTGGNAGVNQASLDAKVYTRDFTNQYKDKSFSSAVNAISKKLKTRPKHSDKYKAEWIVNKAKYGTNCVYVKARSRMHPKTKKMVFSAASAGWRQKTGDRCK